MYPSASAAPFTQVWLLDGWRVHQGGKVCDIPAGQPRMLLTYLLLQPGYNALRSTLVEELWPDAGDERGRRYLSDALYRLRRCLNPAPFLAGAERIGLDMNHAWWVDVWAFYAAATSPDPSQRFASLDLYTPMLAPEISDHWIIVQRLRLQECFVQTALEMAANAEAAHQHTQAETIYRRVLAADPLLESAHRGLMRSLAHEGQLAAALEHYDQLVNHLEREVAVPPSTETRLLADQLFQELDLARRRAETRTVTRLVGRVTERSRLLGALDQARAGHAGMVLLLGEAGIGKSALLHDLANAAAWRGWQIHWGVSQETMAAAPYAPLTAALHEAIPEPRAAQLATTLPGVYFDLLARLFPQFQRAHALPSAAYEATRLPQALAQLCHALQEIAPLLLLLDNIQWGDPALLQLLRKLVPLLYQQRTLLVLAAQPEPLRANAASWAQLEEWDREGLVQVIALGGLTPTELGELASLHDDRGPGMAPSPVMPQQHQALYTASSGNPLLALEILAAGTPHTLLQNRPAIATLVTQRLRRLSVTARQAAGIAAILGSQLSYPQWEALWRAENPYGGELAPQAAELERAEVVQINRNGYAFAHDTLHNAALADMESSVRHRRHAAALTLLQEPGPNQSSDPLVLLYHAQGCENASAIVRYALAAGQQASTAFAFARAESHFTLALTHLAQLASAEVDQQEMESQRYTALLGRIQARHVMALREGELADLDAIGELALSPTQQVAVLTQRAEYHLAVSEMDAAHDVVMKALSIGSPVENIQLAALRLIWARSARERSVLSLAWEQLTDARRLYQAAGDSWGMAKCTDMLGGLAWDQGDYERAALLHDQAANAFEALGDQIHEAQSLNNLGSAYWELGRYAEARATHERSIHVCRELGNKLGEGDNIDNLGGVAWALGDYTLAIRQYRAALDLRESINDLWGVAISLSNLASAYRLQGDYEQALDYYRRSLPLYEQVGRKRGKAYVIEGEGLTLLAMGYVDEAWERLQVAFALRTEIGDRTHLIEIHAALLHAALARQELEQATHHCETILALLTPEDRASLRQLAYFAAFTLADRQCKADASGKAARFLALSLNARDEMAAALPESDRMRFLRNVPLNREITEAAQRYQEDKTVLAGIGNQSKEIQWTLRQAQDYLIDDETERRRHVLTRLLAQAAQQHVAPTHDQLAAGLKVSRRTILRDLAALSERHTL